MNIKRSGALILCVVFVISLLASCSFKSGESPGSYVVPDTRKTQVAQTEASAVSDCEKHVDDDDNGKCDECGISVLISFDFYAINDLHGKFDDSDSQCGVDELTTYLKSMYISDENVIILSSGDMWQGSFESNATRGMILTEWMNELDFVSMTLGNHEYDWGEEYIEKNADAAEFPFLAINIYEKKTGERVDYCRSSVLVERNGVKIGIIGAIGDCYSSISGDKTEGVYFKTGDELTKLVKEESENLREQGAEFIVYSIHDGYSKSVGKNGALIRDDQLGEYYDISLSDGYVDLVFEGHTHMSYVLTDSYGVYHLQNGGDNRGISHAEIKLNFANGNNVVTEAEFVESGRYSSYQEDPIVGRLLEKYADVIGKGKEILGTNGHYRDAKTLCGLIADLYYQTGIERWGDEYDIALGGGFISIRSPKSIDAGDVTYAELNTLFPFDNRIVLCSVRGSDLVKKFFDSKNSNYYISYGEYGDDVRKNIDPNGIYYIVTDTYCSSYAYNNLTVVDYYDDDIYARDLLADYVRNGGMN